MIELLMVRFDSGHIMENIIYNELIARGYTVDVGVVVDRRNGQKVQKEINPELSIGGIFFTMYDSRNNLSKEVVENVQQNLKENIYKTIIPRNVRLAEAPSYGMPITTYAPDSTGADAYRHLAVEMVAYEMDK